MKKLKQILSQENTKQILKTQSNPKTYATGTNETPLSIGSQSNLTAEGETVKNKEIGSNFSLKLSELTREITDDIIPNQELLGDTLDLNTAKAYQIILKGAEKKGKKLEKMKQEGDIITYSIRVGHFQTTAIKQGMGTDKIQAELADPIAAGITISWNTKGAYLNITMKNQTGKDINEIFRSIARSKNSHIAQQ